MKKNITCWLALLLLLILPLGCSNNEQQTETVEEEGAIEKMNKEIAHDIVDKMQSPINEAQAIKQQHEEQWKKAAENLED